MAGLLVGSVQNNETSFVAETLAQEPVSEHVTRAVLAVPIVFSFIFVFGLLGNLAVLYLFSRNARLRTTPNIMIVSLTIGDLLLIMFSVPISATYFTTRHWTFGDAICRLNEFVQTLSLGISIFSLVALSFDRYRCVSNPMGRFTDAKYTLRIVTGTWIVAAILAFPDLVIAHVDDVDGTHVCFPVFSNGFHWYSDFRTVFRFLIYYALPLLVIAVLYLRIAHILLRGWEALAQLYQEGNPQTLQRRLEGRKKVVKVVFSFVVVFAVCWLPQNMFTFWFFFSQDEFDDFWLVFRIVSFCLAFINSCLNPLALIALSESFRTCLRRQLCCCCRREERYPTVVIQFHVAPLMINTHFAPRRQMGRVSGSLISRGTASC